MNELWSIPKDLLFLSGSHLYGYATKDSDKDYRGVFTPPYDYLLGRKRVEQLENKVTDTVIFSLPKFFTLLEVGSPNITELLFASPIEISNAGSLILKNKELFYSRKWLHAIKGFAKSEFYKVRHPEKGEKGESRRTLIENFGFDTKSASHSIRLLYQLNEFIKDRKISFPLPINKELFELRTGNYSLEKYIDWFNDLNSKYDLEAYSFDLPDNPDLNRINNLYYQCIQSKMEKYHDKYHSSNFPSCITSTTRPFVGEY